MGDFPIGFGRYQLVERLALGGMAELFVATSPGEHGFQKRVVIKRLLPHLVNDETYNAMFIDEAKLTARLVHPKIAQTFELGKVDEGLYIAMEYIDGIDVLALLREFAARKRRVDPQLAAWIAHEVLDALDYAHNLAGESGVPLGIVHRDISPSNVLLSLRGDIKLVDFGIARARDPDRAHKSKSGTLKGKYGYMSPEQVIEQGLDSRSDLFSVGVVLAELLTGRRLFAAANELDVLLMVRDAKLTRFDKYGAEVEPGLAEIVRKSLRKNVDERWPTAAAFRDALANWLFEHRHRMTPKLVADVVTELRESVQERRHRSIGPTAVLDEALAAVEPVPPLAPRSPSKEIPAGDRLDSESDAAPLIIVEGGESNPIVMMDYDAVKEEPAPATPIAINDLVSAPMTVPLEPPSARAETVAARPYARAESEMDVPIITPHLAPLAPPPPPGKPDIIKHIEQQRPLRVAAGTLQELADGVPELPSAESISAAVEAIFLPGARAEQQEAAAVRSTDDSAMRAFDDLTEQPKPWQSKDVPRPSAEEVARTRPPTPPTMADISEPPDDSGDFGTTLPLRVLFRLMTARATGLLVVAVGGIKKEIYVRDGQPEYVSSNVASELFGNYLVTKSVLSEGELAMALAMMPHYGGKLGDTLVGLGLLKPLEVFRHLTRQVRSKIIDVCTWTKGSFGWYAGRENPREAFPLDFNAFEILGAGAMELAEEVVEAWIARNAGLRLRVSRTRRVGPERFEVKGLFELCELLDGRRTIGDLVELQTDRNERLKTGRMLCLLEACDLARPA